jgi:hypothetical protein
MHSNTTHLELSLCIRILLRQNVNYHPKPWSQSTNYYPTSVIMVTKTHLILQTLVIIVSNIAIASLFHYTWITESPHTRHLASIPVRSAVGPLPLDMVAQSHDAIIDASSSSSSSSSSRSSSSNSGGIVEAPSLGELDPLPDLPQLSSLPPPPPPPPTLPPVNSLPPGPMLNGPISATVSAATASVQERRCAVIGMAVNTDFGSMYRFIRSLREAAPSRTAMEIIIFVEENMSTEKREMFDAFGVTAVTDAIALLPERERKFHPSSYRWILIRNVMRQRQQLANGAAPFDVVMFSDVRDAIFQSNPCDIVTEPGFYVFMEGADTPIKSCGWNSGWVKDCFGAQVLAQVGESQVSCSGTSLGTWDEALHYTEIMANEIQTNPCERNGVDQGMHNVFVHTDRLLNLHKFTNEQGPIGTVQNMHKVHRDRFGRLLNEDNKVYAVVHQYDRADALVQQYEKQYVYLSPAEQDRKN